MYYGVAFISGRKNKECWGVYLSAMNSQTWRAQKAKLMAEERVPGELWTEVSPGIYIAAGRIPKSERQAQVLGIELDQAHILAGLGHTVYLLPEQGPRGEKHPDAIVDGLVMEFKNITGNIRKVGENFKSARLKVENVFLKIDAPLTRHIVTRRLSGVIRNKGYVLGLIWIYFTNTGEINYWSVDDLR